MKKKPRGINLIERAFIVKRWESNTTKAHIQALIGDDSDQFVASAGQVMFVVLGACITEQVDEDMLEVRILRGGCNALIEQKGVPTILPQHRAAIRAALDACTSLIDALPRRALADSAIDLHKKLQAGDVWSADFEARLAQVVA